MQRCSASKRHSAGHHLVLGGYLIGSAYRLNIRNLEIVLQNYVLLVSSTLRIWLEEIHFRPLFDRVAVVAEVS